MKSVLGVVLAAAVYFGWGMLSWMVLPWYNNSVSQLPEEQLIRDTLKVVIEKPGLYVFPGCNTENGQKPDMKVMKEKARTGPVGMMTIIPQGTEVMTTKNMVVDFVHGLLAAGVIAWIFCIAGGQIKTFVWRVILAVKLGALSWLVRDVPYWNWFHFPTCYTLINLAHLIIGFALMGAVLAFFVPVKDSQA